jgi:5'-deoxynucleotidase YfbR-like HD superfamily hydrolase
MTKSQDWKGTIRASTSDIRRLSSVWRFNSIPVVVQENTAEHSFWVGLYAAMIHREAGGPSDLLSAVLMKSLVHDAAECVTGDVVRTFKYATPELKAEVDRAEDILVRGLDARVQGVIEYADGLVAQSERGSYVKAVVKAADFLSLYAYMRREAMKSNLEIVPFFARMVSDLSEMAATSVPVDQFDVRVFYSALAEEAKEVGSFLARKA